MTTDDEGGVPSGAPGGPRVLFVYYTLSQQARRVAKAMTATFRTEGCEVTEAVIEFTDKRYVKQFNHFPWKHAEHLPVGRPAPAPAPGHGSGLPGRALSALAR
jgi:hypothetical protein